MSAGTQRKPLRTHLPHLHLHTTPPSTAVQRAVARQRVLPAAVLALSPPPLVSANPWGAIKGVGEQD